MIILDITFGLQPPLPIAYVALLILGIVVLRVLARYLFGPPLPLSRRFDLHLFRGTTLLVLLVILLNPVRIDRSAGPRNRSHVSFLVDTSASMKMGTGHSRLDQAKEIIRHIDASLAPEQRPDIGLFRFGRQLVSVPSLQQRDLDALAATAPDTQLLAALRQLTGQSISARRRLVVLFSDGRVREPESVRQMAHRYGKLGIPIHVVPLGTVDRAGEVAVLNVVLPTRVRKYSRVAATVWVRSYGYDGHRTEVYLESVDTASKSTRPLASQPIMLTSGIQAVHLSFQCGATTTQVRARIPIQDAEVSPNNNEVTAELAIDRTKTRILYIEGLKQPFVQRRTAEGNVVINGPHSALYKALTADPDLDCEPLLAIPRTRSFQSIVRNSMGYPKSRTELFTYDAIILSDVSRRQFTDEQLTLLEQWVRERGAGLCMAGSPRGYADGGWADSPVATMLPVTFAAGNKTWSTSEQITVRPVSDAARHPLWTIVSNARRNADILATLPRFRAGHRGLSAKPAARVLAIGTIGTGTDRTRSPMLTIGTYGKGRTMAWAVGLCPQWAPRFSERWGQQDNRYYAKFWRNAAYWLTEYSYLGRRRMSVSTDKRAYRPGETIKLTAHVMDEASHPTTDYRITVLVEPQSLDVDLASDYAPIRWPDGVERSSNDTTPYVAWAEELDMPPRSANKTYYLELPLSDHLAGGAAAQALRIELSAYETSTLVDSTALNIQVLDDPFEQRDPLPDLKLLNDIATLSGGQVFHDARALVTMLEQSPIEPGPVQIQKVPLWSHWWVIVVLVVLLGAEWSWRRTLGLA